MPQFYFDTTNAGQSLVDAVGLAFASVVEARSHAITLLPVIGSQAPMAVGEFRSWTVTVRDDAGAVVCRLIMAIINDNLSPGAGRILSPARRP